MTHFQKAVAIFFFSEYGMKLNFLFFTLPCVVYIMLLYRPSVATFPAPRGGRVHSKKQWQNFCLYHFCQFRDGDGHLWLPVKDLMCPLRWRWVRNMCDKFTCGNNIQTYFSALLSCFSELFPNNYHHNYILVIGSQSRVPPSLVGTNGGVSEYISGIALHKAPQQIKSMTHVSPLVHTITAGDLNQTLS